MDACFAEDQLPSEWEKYIQLNAEYFANRGRRARPKSRAARRRLGYIEELR